MKRSLVVVFIFVALVVGGFMTSTAHLSDRAGSAATVAAEECPEGWQFLGIEKDEDGKIYELWYCPSIRKTIRKLIN